MKDSALNRTTIIVAERAYYFFGQAVHLLSNYIPLELPASTFGKKCDRLQSFEITYY